MSNMTSVGLWVVGGEVGFRPPFTADQWAELEHQALIYKYLVAGLPVPPDLLVPIRRSFEALSARFLQHPTLGYCSYYGKKFDPEPGRCRRTDGKKWRCSKDAYPDSKYCERHMHRGRNRSRKPVESESTSQSLTVMSHVSSASNSGSGNNQSGAGKTYQNLSLYTVANAENLCLSSNVSKLQMESVPYGISSKEYRYMHGMAPDANDRNFLLEASGSVRGLGMDSNTDGTWRLSSSQVLPEKRNDSHLQGNSSQRHMLQAFEPIMDSSMSKQRQQHCFFGTEISSPGSEHNEQHSRRPFFDDWPKCRESWSDLDDKRSNRIGFSSTQLSISIPMASSDFSSKSTCSPSGGDA